ncbi:MAG: hypothetical protein ACLUNZ_13365 [Evtepia sp.]
MEQKNRTILVVAIAVTVLVAVFVSLILPTLTNRPPEVVLPSVEQDIPGAEGKAFLPVEVTPDTVQKVIASLSRPESYYRQLTVGLYWNGGSGGSQVEIWADGGYVRTAISAGDITQYRLVGTESFAFGMPGTRPGRKRAPRQRRQTWPSEFLRMRMF